ncbi:T9SS type A sorting domain-containing protein [Phaeocystidibacter luteus]|uniref:T9SS type A sorting domain-containing protein n=2 Tax=Phaeocystidibacter luteus TaxID=911197 RepID=A0A6N6RM26_9FLAO|nr:T9SS type A sorting domain-containing protein [Phaeocystidibacter luteus]
MTIPKTPSMAKYFIAFLFASFLSSAQTDSISLTVPFSTDSTSLTAWNGERYVPMFLKGINLGVSVPGTFPGELAATTQDYQRWFEMIRAAGFNVIRIYTLHYPRFYDEITAYNEKHPDKPLYFIQGVWLEEEIPNYDHNLYSLNPSFHAEMMANVRAVHGDTSIPQRFGKAYGDFTTDASRWCMAYLMGREIYPEEVLNANDSRPSTTSYNGRFLSIQNTFAAEVFLTAHMDSLIQFEFDEYQTMRPISVSSWPTLDPIPHPEETFRNEDTAQVDFSIVDFSNAPAGLYISYHAYPYYPDFISKTASYRAYSDAYGQNSYLGYLHDLKSHYQNMPLIIAEFGVPSSWGVAHYSASDMNHGGHTEREQGELGMRMLKNIYSANCGGGFYFAWIDEWFKQTWITNPYETTPSARIMWPNYTAAEQNFGLIGYLDTAAQWEFIDSCAACPITTVYAKPTIGDFEVYLETNPVLAEGDTLYVAFDTYGDAEGESVLPNGDTLNINAEFLLEVIDGAAKLYVMRSYDLYGIWHGISDPDQLYRSVPSQSGDWRLVRWKNNQPDQDIQYIGNLDMTDSFRGQSSRDAVIIDTNEIFIRIPWTLLQVSNPTQRIVMDDDRSTAVTEYDTTDGIHLEVRFDGDIHNTSNRITWPTYVRVTQVEEIEKRSYTIMQQEMPTMVDFSLARTDEYDVNGRLVVDVSEGVLANDEQLNGGEMEVVLKDAPAHGLLQLRSDGSFEYQPEPDFLGADMFTYSVFSLGDMSEKVTVHLNVQSGSDRELLRVGPVPTTDVLHVYSDILVDEVIVSDIDGRIVMTYIPSNADFDLNLANLANGAYVLQFMVGEDAWVRKITVQ